MTEVRTFNGTEEEWKDLVKHDEELSHMEKQRIFLEMKDIVGAFSTEYKTFLSTLVERKHDTCGGALRYCGTRIKVGLVIRKYSNNTHEEILDDLCHNVKKEDLLNACFLAFSENPDIWDD